MNEAMMATGRRNQRRGKTGEEIAELLLRAAGVQMVEKIATPYVITNVMKRNGQTWVQMRHSEKVSGDRRGIMPDGRRVLCEVKVRSGNLRKSDFEPHQREALSQNHRFGGVSLVVWVHPDDNFLLRWPFPQFDKARASIRPEDAELYLWDGRS
jgi:hypothetical protein